MLTGTIGWQKVARHPICELFWVAAMCTIHYWSPKNEMIFVVIAELHRWAGFRSDWCMPPISVAVDPNLTYYFGCDYGLSRPALTLKPVWYYVCDRFRMQRYKTPHGVHRSLLIRSGEVVHVVRLFDYIQTCQVLPRLVPRPWKQYHFRNRAWLHVKMSVWVVC